MQQDFSTYEKCLDAFKSDSAEILSAMKRIENWAKELDSGKRKPDQSAFKAEIKTIDAQLEKLECGFKDVRRQYFARVDAINAKLVTRIRMFASLPNSGAGVRLLLAECQDFEKAGNDFVTRDAIFNGICNILEGVADTTCKTRSFETRSRSAGEQVTHCESTELVDQHPLFRSPPPEAKSPFQFKF